MKYNTPADQGRIDNDVTSHIIKDNKRICFGKSRKIVWVNNVWMLIDQTQALALSHSCTLSHLIWVDLVWVNSK